MGWDASPNVPTQSHQTIRYDTINKYRCSLKTRLDRQAWRKNRSVTIYMSYFYGTDSQFPTRTVSYTYIYIYLFIDIALHSHYTCLIQSAFITLFWLLVPMLNTSRLGSGALQQRCWSTASKAKRKDRASLCTRSTAYWRRSCYCYLISCVRMLPLFLRTLWGTWELDKISLGECGVLLVTWVRAFWCFSTFAMSAKTLPPYRGECCSFHAGPPACIACSCKIYIYI